jgi:hypothetical protein
MANPREEAIRSASTVALGKVIKRMRYDQRQIVQVLRCSPEKAQAILSGNVDEFSTEEIKKFIEILG